MSKELFGRLESGEEIYKFTLTSESSTAAIINYGATINSFCPFGKEIIGGFDTLEDYVRCRSYHGSTVGRVSNRIVGGSFTMDGEVYELARNNGEHCLHGGIDGYTHKVWQVIDYGSSFVKLGYTSPDGESGFPSEVVFEALFSLSGSSLKVSYKGIPKGKTPIMLTTHGFFNLDGYVGGVRDHIVRIYADKYTEVDENRLPTGRHASVDGTPFDFRVPKRIGEDMDKSPIGYDHNYIVKGNQIISDGGNPLTLAIEVTGRELRMKAYTDQPGFQFYVLKKASETAPLLHGGIKQGPVSAFCIEPQVEPNCVRAGRGFYDVGEVYSSTIIYSVEKV